MARRALLIGLLLLGSGVAARGEETVVSLRGEVPDGEETHFFLPFDVPEGTVEIEVRHDDLSSENILDWGLEDADGFRGWGGGNSEPAVVGIEAASRSYVPGPIAAGSWRVVVGKAKIRELPARYEVDILLRDEATLAPQTERRPYQPVPPLATGTRWYSGDFHVHSRESGDARPTIATVLDFAAGRGLDFVMLSEHNTNSQLSYYDSAQSDSPTVLLIPGVEFTTYAGHANGIGATEWVDHRIGVEGTTITDAVRRFHDQGALFSINHPLLNVGDLCIGCGWNLDVDPREIDAVEVRTGIFPGVAYWEDLVAQGSRAVPIGGSDDHRAGQDLGVTDSPIGTPTTLVWTDELSVDGIVRGLADGRTVVKMHGPADPMIESEIDGRRRGARVEAVQSILRATVTGGDGLMLRVIRNGETLEEIEVRGDSFVHETAVDAPELGEDRYRHELGRGADLFTLTSYTWLAMPSVGGDEDDGCAVTRARGSIACSWLAAAALLFALGKRSRARRSRRIAPRARVSS